MTGGALDGNPLPLLSCLLPPLAARLGHEASPLDVFFVGIFHAASPDQRHTTRARRRVTAARAPQLHGSCLEQPWYLRGTFARTIPSLVYSMADPLTQGRQPRPRSLTILAAVPSSLPHPTFPSAHHPPCLKPETPRVLPCPHTSPKPLSPHPTQTRPSFLKASRQLTSLVPSPPGSPRSSTLVPYLATLRIEATALPGISPRRCRCSPPGHVGTT